MYYTLNWHKKGKFIFDLPHNSHREKEKALMVLKRNRKIKNEKDYLMENWLNSLNDPDLNKINSYEPRNNALKKRKTIVPRNFTTVFLHGNCNMSSGFFIRKFFFKKTKQVRSRVANNVDNHAF